MRSRQCNDCGVIYDIAMSYASGRQGHVCFERFCKKCKSLHNPERGCFILPLQPKDNEIPYRLVCFDLETTQHQFVQTPAHNGRQKRVHEPNFIAAKVVCPQCIASGVWKKSLSAAACTVCGPCRTISFSHQQFRETAVDRQVICSNPLKSFVQWLLYELPLQYDTYAYSHYGGRFDMVLTFRELFMEGLNPKMIRNGNKLYEMKNGQRKGLNPNIIFRDSFNLIPSSLASLVATFGLEVEEKPFFPHLANRPENYGRTIYPTPADYLANGMMPAQRKRFDEWYAEHGGQPFQLDEALASYCTNDVDILTAALISFRNEFFEITSRPPDANGKADRAAYTTPHNGIDILRCCLTIAGACMRHFKTNHLAKDHVAIVPEKGYDNADNQSRLAISYMKWYAEKHYVEIQTAHSAGGEKRVDKYRLDGWIEAEQRGLEINGCVWHACKRCYPSDEQRLPHGKAGMVRENNKQRLDFIKSKVAHVDVVWECEINRMLERDAEMRAAFANYLDTGPINIRQAFMGGRTGPLNLLHTVQPGEKISYVDFTSLYPFCNFTTPYPVGHPSVHVLNMDTNWTSAEHNLWYAAIMKVFVVPPRDNNVVPVLGVKLNDRLLFPRCMACSKRFPVGAVKEEYRCEHSDEERGWVATTTSLELNEAMEAGYVVKKVYRVLAYEETDDELFRAYIREWMVEKMHSSGFDSSIRGDAEAEAAFITESRDRFGFNVDPAKMVRNPGRRALAKLALNNLWGKFSMRNGLMQTLITDDPSELGKMLDDRSFEVMALDELTPETILISYKIKKEWVEEHSCSNVVISVFTTAMARMLIWQAMQKVKNTRGCKLLYTDTDSIIYVHPIGDNPLTTGPHLGQLTDEYPEHQIVEYCSGGAKQYGLKLRRNAGEPDADFEYVLKVRGITLNHDVVENQGLRYENFKAQVMRYVKTGMPQPINIVYPHFLRPNVKLGQVTTEPMTKIYKPFVGKGVVDPHTYDVLDFGHF